MRTPRPENAAILQRMLWWPSYGPSLPTSAKTVTTGVNRHNGFARPETGGATRETHDPVAVVALNWVGVRVLPCPRLFWVMADGLQHGAVGSPAALY